MPSAVNPRHVIVANAVMEGATDKDAARAADYSSTTVTRSKGVQALLAEAREELEDITTLRRIDVMEMFLEAIDMARTLADPAQMINGTDKLAKMMGYYAPETKRIELTTTENALQNKFQQMTDKELLEIAAGRARVIDAEVVQTTDETPSDPE